MKHLTVRGLYTIITFPFLFGMMFGDVCHGLILVGFGSWMVLSEKKYMNQRATNEIWKIFFGGRYVILLLGLFSIYTGFIYNEWFAQCASFGKSSWVNSFTADQLASAEMHEIDPSGEHRPPYIYGIDPIWTLIVCTDLDNYMAFHYILIEYCLYFVQLASNQIMFENSIKMKMSIIVGVTHMIFGIVLSFFNYLYFNRRFSIYLQFIPEILFLICLFFWLVFMIYYKWFEYGAKFPQVEKGSSCAPQILIYFIDMVLMATTKPLGDDCTAYMFPAQQTVQMSLLFIALLCIPLLLLGTPIYELKHNKKKQIEALKKLDDFRREHKHNDEDTATKESEEEILAEVKSYSVPFGELMIHQGVHTIEFVLSTISHTASYLRLWALSLAHAKLSDMLWIMVLSKLALQKHSIIGCVYIFVIFAVFAVFTMCIMVVMEGLSAFLHTLRLHWVEFMSKFYSGGGYPFRPFHFKAILEVDDKSDMVCKKARKAE